MCVKPRAVHLKPSLPRAPPCSSFQARALQLAPRAERLLDEVTDFSQLIPAAYSDTFMPRLCARATSYRPPSHACLAVLWLGQRISGPSETPHRTELGFRG